MSTNQESAIIAELTRQNEILKAALQNQLAVADTIGSSPAKQQYAIKLVAQIAEEALEKIKPETR